MRITEHPMASGHSGFTVEAGDHQFEITSFGAQILAWRIGETPIFFSNTGHAIDDGSKPYRGGAPICFPHFGMGTLLPNGETVLPQHGRARTTVWPFEIGDDRLTFRAELDAPEGYGPAQLRAELAYGFGDGLQVEFQVENVGENPTPFQFVLHSYWGTPNPATAIVRGLGERYLDNLRGFQEDFDPAPESPHLPPYDRVYPDAAAELEIRADRFLVHAETVGCAGAVLWSPGEGHTIPDLGSPEFLCVESGVIRPARVLAPGEAHSVRIRYRVERL